MSKQDIGCHNGQFNICFTCSHHLAFYASSSSPLTKRFDTNKSQNQQINVGSSFIGQIYFQENVDLLKIRFFVGLAISRCLSTTPHPIVNQLPFPLSVRVLLSKKGDISFQFKTYFLLCNKRGYVYLECFSGIKFYNTDHQRTYELYHV